MVLFGKKEFKELLEPFKIIFCIYIRSQVCYLINIFELSQYLYGLHSGVMLL